MRYGLEIEENIDRIFEKLLKKNRKQLQIIRSKVDEIRDNPQRYKSLRGIMKGTWRVHIDKSFVLTYGIDEERKVVRLIDYGHHDDVYR